MIRAVLEDGIKLLPMVESKTRSGLGLEDVSVHGSNSRLQFGMVALTFTQVQGSFWKTLILTLKSWQPMQRKLRMV